MMAQTYLFHSGLQRKAFGAGAGCQVSHYVLTGLCFPRTTFTTRETEKCIFNLIHALGNVIIFHVVIVSNVPCLKG